MQLREMTTKEINGSHKVVFKSVMTVLQDQDFVIENTDFDSGLIVASKENSEGFTAEDFMTILFLDRNHAGQGSKVKVSATVGDINENLSRVRLNIQEIQIKKRNYRK